MTYGPSGAGKSFHTLDKGLHIAAGIPFQGRPVKQGVVVYVAGEGRAGINKRIRAWCEFHEVDIASLQFYVTRQSVPFLEPTPTETLVELIAKLPTGLVYVCVDTLNRNFGDGDENSTKDMSAFVDALDQLRVKTGACVEVVHHTGKGEAQTARGSSSLRAALDTEVSVKATAGGFKVVCTKQKDAEPFPEILFEFKEIDLGEREGERITSLVPVPGAMAEATSAMLATHTQKLTRSREAAVEVITDLWREVYSPEDMRKPVRFEHVDFIARMRADPYRIPKQTAADARDWAVKESLLLWPSRGRELEIGPGFNTPE